MSDACAQCSMGLRLYRAALWFTGLFTVAHLITLPLSISYDGFQYIDLADVLFSPRFPADWHPFRTPLYPLALKLSFWLLGRHALAVIAVTTAMGLGGILVLGAAVRRVAGDVPAALSLVLTSIMPTLVTYQHFALTEAGTFFFLAVVVALLLWTPAGFPGLWAKACLLVAAITAGFYWRQTILPLTLLAALLHAAAAWRQLRAARAPWSLGRLAAVAAQLALIAVLPFVLAKPWNRYSDQQYLRRAMICQGIMSQALLPPDHPSLGDKAQLYRDAIAAGKANGNFYSGIVGLPQETELTCTVPNAWRDRSEAFFLELIRQDPQRYCAAVGRMIMLTAGCHARLNQTANACAAVLSPERHAESNSICTGPPHLQASIRQRFSQNTSPSYLMRRLWKIRKSFDHLVVLAMAVAAVGTLAGLVLRNLPLVTLYGVPLAFQLPYVLLLTTVDRFALPTQAMAVAILPAFPVLLWRAIADSRRSHSGLRPAVITNVPSQRPSPQNSINRSQALCTPNSALSGLGATAR